MSCGFDSTKQKLLDTESELALKQALFDVAQAQFNDANKGDAPLVIPTPALIRSYSAKLRRLNMLVGQEADLAQRFRAGNAGLRMTRADIKALDDEIIEMESDNPALIVRGVNGGGGLALDPLALEKQRVILKLTKERVERYLARIAEIEESGLKLSEYGPQILELERRRNVDAERLQVLQTSLEKIQVDEKIDAKHMPGMNTLEEPTPPERRIDDKMLKIILAIAGSGFAIGVGLAFLIELMLNRGLRRPIELETHLQIPLLLAIPQMPRLRGSAGLLEYKGAQGGELYLPDDGDEVVVPPAQPDHFILPYTDAIRDRLIFHFELHDMRHKPKLVALTGLSEGAGTSTLAAGLAMAFAGSDKAKVLLVDMNSGENGQNKSFSGLHRDTLSGALEIGRQDNGLEGLLGVSFSRVWTWERFVSGPRLTSSQGP
jgi:hypothetical protein